MREGCMIAVTIIVIPSPFSVIRQKLNLTSILLFVWFECSLSAFIAWHGTFHWWYSYYFQFAEGLHNL